MTEFYERYKMLRDKKKVTDSEVSRDTGISRSSFNSWRNGKNKAPSAAVAQKLADYFGVSAKYLITGKSDPPTPIEAAEMADLIIALRNNRRVKNITDYLLRLDDDALMVVETFIEYNKRSTDVAPND